MNNEKNVKEKFNFVNKKCSINNSSSNKKKKVDETTINDVDNNINNNNGKNNNTINDNVNNESNSFNNLVKDLPKIIMPPSLPHSLLSIANTLPIHSNNNKKSLNANSNVLQRNTPPFQSPPEFLSLNEKLLQLNKNIRDSPNLLQSNLQKSQPNLLITTIKNNFQEINSNIPTPPSPSSFLNRKTSRFERDFSNNVLFGDRLIPPLHPSLDKNVYMQKSQSLSPFGLITNNLNSRYTQNIPASNILNNNDYSLMTTSPLNIINTKDFISQK